MRTCSIVLITLAMLGATLQAQPREGTATLLARFDAEQDLTVKERLLRELVGADPDAGPALLSLARQTRNAETIWMAARGFVELKYTDAAPFLVEGLRHSDAYVRANSARALGDLRVGSAAAAVLEMFAAEAAPNVLEQGSLALTLLNGRSAAPALRMKIPMYSGQTRAWLIGALGQLGDPVLDVPMIASYLKDVIEGSTAASAIQRLTGADFGADPTNGPTSIPTPATKTAIAWWEKHQDAWPRCDDCRKR